MENERLVKKILAIDEAAGYFASNYSRWRECKNDSLKSIYGKFSSHKIEEIFAEGSSAASGLARDLLCHRNSYSFPSLYSYVNKMEDSPALDLSFYNNLLNEAERQRIESHGDNQDFIRMFDLYSEQLKEQKNTWVILQSLKEEPEYLDSSPEKSTSKLNSIKMLSKIGRELERRSSLHSDCNEESLRDIILVSLASYSDFCVGEAKNAKGKTDILIRDDFGNNELILECKFWRGPKSFDDAIDQLLSYLTVRDTNAALMIFVTSVNLSEVYDKAEDSMRSHERYISKEENKDNADNLIRFKFSNIYQLKNPINLTLFLIHTPAFRK